MVSIICSFSRYHINPVHLVNPGHLLSLRLFLIQLPRYFNLEKVVRDSVLPEVELVDDWDHVFKTTDFITLYQRIIVKHV